MPPKSTHVDPKAVLHRSPSPKHTPSGASQPAGGIPQTPKGLCVFDIDNTLTRGPLAGTTSAACGPLPAKPVCVGCVSEDRAALYSVSDMNIYAAPYAKAAVAACKAKGYGVTVATGERCRAHFVGDKFDVNTRLPFLKELGFGTDVVKEGKGGRLLVGPSLQCTNAENGGNKANMVKTLMKQHGTPASKVVFWDDNSHYRRQVRTVPGVTVSNASTTCGGGWCPEGCGLTKADYRAGMAALKKHQQ